MSRIPQLLQLAPDELETAQLLLDNTIVTVLAFRVLITSCITPVKRSLTLKVLPVKLTKEPFNNLVYILSKSSAQEFVSQAQQY